MKLLIKSILLFNFLLFQLNGFCGEKEKLKIGIYIEDIYNIDYKSSSYEIVFWVWINSKDSTYKIANILDINNATEVNYSLESNYYLLDKQYHQEAKVTAKILNIFDVTAFPFDVQTLIFKPELAISCEEAELFYDDVNSRVKPERIEDWKIDNNIFISQEKFQYQSNFGNTNLKSNPQFEGLVIKINLSRKSMGLFSKFFLTLFISILLASCSLLLPNRCSEEKFGLIVGSLFTSIGNKYITDDLLPLSDSYNLSDSIHILTFLFISAIAVFAIVEQRYKMEDNLKRDWLLFYSTLIAYVLLIICISYYFFIQHAHVN
jgi:hypothetical protein